MIESIRQNDDASEIFVLCLDEASHSFLTTEPVLGLIPLTLQDLLRKHPELQKIQSERSRTEFIFTAGPTFLSHIMQHHLDPLDVLVYLDADLYFFDRPALVLDELGSSSVGIIEHRYPKKLGAKLAKYGRFNVGWVGFRNDPQGIHVLNWWAERCLEWCSDVPQGDGRYADQGYLNAFPDFASVQILQSPGFNLAPWNTGSHQITKTANGIHVDDSRLVFFHFHGIRETRRWYITSQLLYKSPTSRALMEGVYKPYLSHLKAAEMRAFGDIQQTAPRAAKRGNGIRGTFFGLQKRLVTVVSIISGNAIRKQILDH
jgi:hypothetical protein